MRLATDSLVVRIGAVFLAGAVALQAAVLLVTFWPGGAANPTFFMASPSEAAAMALAVEQAPPPLQPTIVRALNSGPMVVRLEPAPPVVGAGGAPDAAPRLRRIFAQYGEALGGRPFWVQTRGGADVRTGRGETVVAAGRVRLVVGLRTGQALVIERTTPAVGRFIHRVALIAASVLVILGVVLLVSLRQAATPVSALAKAARRLATDLSIPDLPVRGAYEIKELSTAFNEMKRTIRALVDDRTRMLAAIAHDLRTYLTRLRLRAEFIDDPDQRARAVADLDEMAALLDDTLTFSREVTISGAPRRRSVDVASEVRALAQARREMGQDVTADVAAGAPLAAFCAPLALRRMLDNLVDNAVRYAAGATVRARRDGDRIVLAVEDDGPGVPREALARLTEPFERLEASRGRQTGGSGLGLAIVKSLAESQGGALTIENRAGGGLRAEIRLPASA